MRTLVWFRADLRVRDNTALWRACQEADEGVVGLFLLAPGQWRAHDWGGSRVEFVLRNLAELADRLQELEIPLLIATADRFADAPREVLAAARRARCSSVHFNKEYELNEVRRDEAVVHALEEAGLRATPHDDQVVLAPGEVRTGEGRFFTVFTPFKKAWTARLKETGAGTVLGTPRRQSAVTVERSPVPAALEGFTSAVPADLWPGGEAEALRRLKRFAERRIARYKTDRDSPILEGTSRLSAYLAVGAISPRQCLRAAVEANGGKIEGGGEGPAQWISELVWREFYKHILIGFPRVCMSKAFKPVTDNLRWRYDEKDFAAWCEGRTGVPLVDAAMRQLAAEGWMHNRLRMVSAMYLTKDLFIDWRWGEKYFMERLVDGDLASNNGGWQWSASTGTDAAPYFRIFNPVSQSRAHDPEGEFIRRYVPELAALDSETIHDPPPLARGAAGYPAMIADHAAARDRVMHEFKRLGN